MPSERIGSVGDDDFQGDTDQEKRDSIWVDEQQPRLITEESNKPAEFTEANLLMGFMADFGVKPKTTAQPDTREEPAPQVSDSTFKRASSDPFTNLDTPHMQNQVVFKRVIDRIQEHFTLQNRPQLDSLEQIEAILKAPDQMESLLDFLRYERELSEAELEPVKKHFALSTEIKEAEGKKKQAAMEEDYESAAKYKKQII